MPTRSDLTAHLFLETQVQAEPGRPFGDKLLIFQVALF